MVTILVLVVIAGYLVWLRSRYQPPISPQINEEIQVTPSPASSPEQSASPSASPQGKEATGSVRQRSATSGGTRR
ncbi:hypothetical protein HYW41_00490 [Candidatus Daviesbacteria bacterium]|nr:hypothetical protein [Candidatus Daviesbacteria bacterium]